MFNRVAQREVVTSHNIQGIMSRSRKRTPICCWVCCKSQKRGKRMCNRKFRHQERQKMSVGDFHTLPLRTHEVMSPWNLGGDGKGYFHPQPEEEWYIRLMRK